LFDAAFFPLLPAERRRFLKDGLDDEVNGLASAEGTPDICEKVTRKTEAKLRGAAVSGRNSLGSRALLNYSESNLESRYLNEVVPYNPERPFG
jgi:hypothetical protein